MGQRPWAATPALPSRLPTVGQVTMTLASERSGVDPVLPAGPEALDPGEATQVLLSGAWLVHKDEMLTGRHGQCGSERGAQTAPSSWRHKAAP